MSLTCEEMAVQALARANEVTNNVPATRSLLYRRFGLRQRELMALAAKVNPEYYGVCATSALDVNGATDLNDIVEPVPTPELIQLVTVENPGTSRWAVDQVVAIVPVDDPDVALAPRATLRDLVIQQVGTDLAGVVTIEIHYSRLSAALGSADANTVIELQSPFDQLIEIDGARYLLHKAPLDEGKRKLALDALSAEEAPLLASYLAHVRSYGPLVTRFGESVIKLP